MNFQPLKPCPIMNLPLWGQSIISVMKNPCLNSKGGPIHVPISRNVQTICEAWGHDRTFDIQSSTPSCQAFSGGLAFTPAGRSIDISIIFFAISGHRVKLKLATMKSVLVFYFKDKFLQRSKLFPSNFGLLVHIRWATGVKQRTKTIAFQQPNSN